MKEVRARNWLVLLVFSALAGAQTEPPKHDAARSFPIDSITVEGNRILTVPAITNAFGLKRGDRGDAAIFDAARDRLLATGYFDTVAYRYKPSATGGYDLTLEVQEVTALYPIRVDALPVTTADVVAFLKAKDPLFPGKLPGTKPVIDRTAHEIEELLARRNHNDQVTGRMAAIAPGQFEVNFTPARGVPVVAGVTFEGSRLISATALHNAISEVAFGQPYTETSFRVLLENQIRPLYESKGHLKVTFPKITTEPSAQVTGVDVKVTVDEGDEYKLTRVAIAGRGASDSARILKAAKIPQMTVADFDQVKQAAGRVKDWMRHQGYLDVDVTTERKLDDEKKTAEFFLVVEPGPAYTFGKLTVSGLGLDGEAAIRKMWTVKTGDPFPADYPDYFISKVKEEGLFDNLAGAKAVPDVKPEAHVVDVTLDFTGTPARERAPRRQPGAIPH
jgi:outer membrane protein insertion porin family